ncbi:hypothetical protein AB3G33_08380 [Flavobacterium sp. WC2421]|uniref:Uncharacterized protein n=3 Tax=unclassified Flavobacterium TaxID=196869 RepID=A0AB39W8R6_9FLAO
MENKDTPFLIDFTIKKSKPPKNSEWDKYLEDYNNYTKKYIKHYKKSLTGNTISLSIYPYMKIKSEIIAEKLYKAQIQSALTTKQVERFIQIKMKLVKIVC